MPDPLDWERDRLRPFRAYIPPATAALLGLERRACHWPIGDVESEDFRFCGVTCAQGSYCRAHRRLALRRRH